MFSKYRVDPGEVPAKRPPNPSDPTLAEKEAHWACGHLPARLWCPVCVKGRGKEDPHYKKARHNLEHGLPTVSMDYAEVGNEDKLVKSCSSGEKIGLVTRSAMWWTAKGSVTNTSLTKFLRSLQTTGRTRINLKTDGELAIVQLQKRIISQREQETIAVNPPAYDPQSNGLAGKAVQDVKAQLRVLKLGLEARIEHRIPMESPIWEWMIPHSADAVNRFRDGKDDKTLHYSLSLRPFKSKVFEFGEQVLAKPKRRVGVANQRALVARWHEATWVGFCTRIGEHIVVLQDGGHALRVRTVRPVSTKFAIGQGCRLRSEGNPRWRRALASSFSTPSRRTATPFYVGTVVRWAALYMCRWVHR